MHPGASHRMFAALFAAVVTVPFALSLLSAEATASAAPDPAGATTVFQVPARFVAGCTFSVMECWGLPPLTTVVPSVTPSAPGMATFAAEPAARVSAGSLECVDVWVHWRNLTTGATGATVLRRVAVDYTQPFPPNPWCRYTPETADVGGGTVVATADVVAVGAPPDAYRIVVNPGLGTFQIP
ncbi:hypothetical protein [Prescottella agglutinans]|uniref:Secreted protein n=1 Tax=Prescottella agglutinans TaxID=1644129 RepID=A0ABT6MBS3_9NOCA|nr:hypothetical protein [Prescottella agglutinans]MDH6281763.1 hypothetical protein [Prescottella agglutinans]